MSLKAKIESVIYAAEEPVTLSQLVAIFAAEVPLPEAPPESLEALQASLALESDHHHDSAAAEITVMDDSGFMQDAPQDAASESAGDPELQDGAPVTTPAVVPAADPDEAAKRAARIRDREIRDHLRTIVDELIADYALGDRGIEIREIAGGFRMATKPEFHDAVRAFVKSLKPSMKLSNQALETLAVIAYKQPVTAPEVGEIRGVDSGGVLAGLISRKLVTTAGRKQVIGRPILYKTTRQFLMGFGLKDLGELPSLEEFEKIASELAESDALEAAAMEDRAGLPPVVEDGTLSFEEPGIKQDEGAAVSSSEEETLPPAEVNETSTHIEELVEKLETVPETRES